MLNTVGEIIESRRYLEGKYSVRDTAYSQIRRLYNADYWSGKEVGGIKLVYNLIASIVDRYTDFMALAPDFQVIPADVTNEAYAIADRQEKLLYAQWELNSILPLQQQQAHLQSLLGFFGFVALPDFKSKERYVRIHAAIPEYTLIMPRTDNIHDYDHVIMKCYNYSANRSLYEPSLNASQKDTLLNCMYYFDEEKIIYIEDGKEKSRIEHGFGFIPAAFGQNRIKPHSIEGSGDVDQALALNEYLNELISWYADILEYASNPITIIKGLTGDQKLPTGPGGTVSIGENGSVSFLQANGQPPGVEQMINRVIKAIQDMTNMNDPVFADNVPSGTSAAAVQSFMSGIQAAMGRKQLTLGDAYVRMNEIIFKIIERMFGNKDIVVRGTKKGNVFVERMKGSEINGNYRNRVIWPPGVLDVGSKLNLEISKLNNRIQSRRSTMENVGIQSPKDEMERIRQEDEEEIQRQARLANPSGIPPQQAAELSAASQQLKKLGGPQSNGGGAQQLVQAIQGIPRIKDAVFFIGQEGDTFMLALTNMADKATIVNRLPAEFKGKVNFRKYDPDKDQNAQMIVDNAEAA